MPEGRLRAMFTGSDIDVQQESTPSDVYIE